MNNIKLQNILYWLIKSRLKHQRQKEEKGCIIDSVTSCSFIPGVELMTGKTMQISCVSTLSAHLIQ